MKQADRAQFALKCSALALAAAITLLTAPVPIVAQDLAAERSMVLTSIGFAKELALDLQPLRDSLGLVFQQVVTEPTAKTLRAHFVIARPDDSWGLQIKDAAGAVAWSTFDSQELGSEFWSDEIAGSAITVEVFSSKPSNALRLRLDKIAATAAKTVPESITDHNDLVTIEDQADWIVELGRSVARLRFVADDGKMYVCTAFLVTPAIMLTNDHCIATEDERLSALVDFDFDSDGPPGSVARLSALLDHDFALDYSLVRLDREVDRPALTLDREHPEDAEQLLIIQHPAGEPKQISLRDCKVDGKLVTGRGGTPTDFGHQCDTMGGSSGSPVLHFTKRSVVGLHHLGIAEGSANLFNRASHIDLVLDSLTPELREEIEGDSSSGELPAEGPGS